MPVCIIFKKKRRFKDDGADTTSAYKNTSSFSKLPEQSIIKQEKQKDLIFSSEKKKVCNGGTCFIRHHAHITTHLKRRSHTRKVPQTFFLFPTYLLFPFSSLIRQTQKQRKKKSSKQCLRMSTPKVGKKTKSSKLIGANDLFR